MDTPAPKTIPAAVARRVLDWSDERRTDDPIMVTLIRGFAYCDNDADDVALHVRGFPNVKAAIKGVRGATACACSRCLAHMPDEASCPCRACAPHLAGLGIEAIKTLLRCTGGDASREAIDRVPVIAIIVNSPDERTYNEILDWHDRLHWHGREHERPSNKESDDGK